LNSQIKRIAIKMEKNQLNIQDQIGNSNPFTVPENYFQDFAAKIDAQITEEKVSTRKLLKPWMYMAAMFVGVFLMGQIFFTIYQRYQSERDAELYELYLMTQLDYSANYDLFADLYDE